jgi:hypothetical protein
MAAARPLAAADARVEPPPAPVDAPPAPAPDWSRVYAFGRGFTWRREPFGGILYHYEGVQPDPRVTFVDSAFTIDLLEALRANPGATLGALVAGVQAHCALDAAQRGRVESFFATLIARGALVPV